MIKSNIHILFTVKGVDIFLDTRNFTPSLALLQDNMEFFRNLITSPQSSTLTLDPRIYAKDTTLASKSFKINDTIYSDFTRFCEENYSYLKLQDLLSQALLEFIENHQP